MADQEQSWWAIRMVVEIVSIDRTFSQFEDRIILVRAGDAKGAEEKGQAFAADYEKNSLWKVQKIVDVWEIGERELADGTEIYSAFIDGESAAVLMKGGDSPIAKWRRQNPDKDIGDATVGDVLDAWENEDNEA